MNKLIIRKPILSKKGKSNNKQSSECTRCKKPYVIKNIQICNCTGILNWQSSSWEEEFGAAYIVITSPNTWKDGKPVFYGRKYPTVYNALRDVVGNILSAQQQGCQKSCCIQRREFNFSEGCQCKEGGEKE